MKKSKQLFEKLINQIKESANPDDIPAMRAYHKIERPYFGARLPNIRKILADYRKTLSADEVLSLADILWTSNIHEARIAAGILLENPKLTDFAEIWKRLDSFKEDLDSWCMSDCLAHAAFKVLAACPEYLDELENKWLPHKSVWVRRACLVFTLYLAKPGMDPSRSLKWAASMVNDKDWFIQKAIGWYLRELSKSNQMLVKDFLSVYSKHMKAFAVREAKKYLKK